MQDIFIYMMYKKKPDIKIIDIFLLNRMIKKFDNFD